MSEKYSAVFSEAAKRDPSSFADLNEFRSKHIDIEWVIDFGKNTIKGAVEISLETVNRAKMLRLDTKDLKIQSVKEISKNIELERYALDERNTAEHA